MYSLKATEYPNREIRIVLNSYGPASRSPKLSQKELWGFSFDESQYETHETEIAPTSFLDIRSDFETQQKKPGFGLLPRLTRFGTRARRMLLRVGGALDRLDPEPRNCLFLTGTLPGSTREAMRAIAEWSGYIVHRLKAWIAKRCVSKYDYYVWERQRRGALHLHYCLHVPDPALRRKIKEEFKNEWIRLMKSVSERSGIDVFGRAGGGSWRDYPRLVQAYSQECRRSVAAYLSKYLGKRPGKDDEGFCPSRWWGVSRPLRSLLGQLSKEIVWLFSRRREAESLYEDLMQIVQSLAPKAYNYECKHGARVTVGYGLWQMEEHLKLRRIKLPRESSARQKLLALANVKLSLSTNFVRGRLRSSYGVSTDSAGLGEYRFRISESSRVEQILAAIERLNFHLGLSFRGEEREAERVQLIETLTRMYLSFSRIWREHFHCSGSCQVEQILEIWEKEGEIDATIEYWNLRATGTTSDPADRGGSG